MSRHSLGYLGRLDSAHGNGLGDKTSVHDVPEVYCSAEGRPQSTPLSLRKAKPWRHGLERLSLRVHNRRGRLGVPLLPVKRDQKPAPRRGDGTLAEILFGTHQTKRSGSVGTCGGAVALNDMSMLVSSLKLCHSCAATECSDRVARSTVLHTRDLMTDF